MRLVRLAPSANFGHISVTAQLIETSWDECNYEALSYCWGKNQKKKRILLNGEQFEITADLYNALEHLCLEHESRQLWVGFLYGWANGSLTLSSQIDAICINQTDTDEKSLQVQRMRDIYQNAERVLIWTGPSTTNTQQAFEKVNQLLACNDINAREDIWNGKDDQWIHCLNEIIKRPVRKCCDIQTNYELTRDSTGLVRGLFKRLSSLEQLYSIVATTQSPSLTLPGS
jgi:hypothetical protein